MKILKKTKETFFKYKEDHPTAVVPIENAPLTKRQRRAVDRIQQARRDAAVAAGEAREIAHARKDSREAEKLGKPRTRAAAKSDRWQRGYERRMHRKMRKAAKTADGRNITGRIARVLSTFDPKKPTR